MKRTKFSIKNKSGVLYCCDNMELMIKLPNNLIDLIYCDILYGTGKKFKDYQDLKPIRSEIEDHYIPRIKEMHRILKNTGSIYLQMDYRISHWIRCIIDNIFGYKNYIQTVYWEYDAGGKFINKFKPNTDEILIYSKTKNYTFNIDAVRIPYHKNTMCRIKGYANQGIILNPLGKQCGSNWKINAVKAGHYTKPNEEYANYATQKPEVLLERIIKAGSNKDDLIADFYCGSGTALVIANRFGRNYIGCDINPKAIKITKERISIKITKEETSNYINKKQPTFFQI